MTPAPSPTAGQSAFRATGTGTNARNRGATTAHGPEAHAGLASHLHHSKPGLSSPVVMSSETHTNHHASAAPSGFGQPAALQDRRRSSVFSNYSVQEAKSEFEHEILNPKPAGAEPTKPASWKRRIPLMFVFLPPAAGMVFKNGAAFLVDMLLLILAGLFLHWSATAPWDWYESAQEARAAQDKKALDEAEALDNNNHATSGSESTSEEESNQAGETQPDANTTTTANNITNNNTMPKTTTTPKTPTNPPKSPQDQSPRAAAAAKARATLCRHELVAFLCCFAAPAAASYLLYWVRWAMSPPTGSLLSQLSIAVFVLAAEVRPFSHVIKMLQEHTLHLQRVVEMGRLEAERKALARGGGVRGAVRGGGGGSGSGSYLDHGMLGMLEREQYDTLVGRLVAVEARLESTEKRQQEREQEREREWAALRQEVRQEAAAVLRLQTDALDDALSMSLGRYARLLGVFKDEMGRLRARVDEVADGGARKRRRSLIGTAVGGGLALAKLPLTATYGTLVRLLSDLAAEEESEEEAGEENWGGIDARLMGNGRARSYSSPPPNRRR